MAGLPGTGKTTLALSLAARTQGAVLSKDEIRAALFAPPGSAQNDIEYSVQQDDFVMEIMLQTARYLVRAKPDRVIFLDGRPFSRRYQIDRVFAFAAELSQPCRIIECVCSDKSARHRLDVEPDPTHPAHNRSFALYQEVKGRFEPITHLKTVIDTDQPLTECIEPAMAALG